MANRIPLILDTTGENKLKELPVGDNLDLSGSSIVNVQNLSVLGNLNAPDLIVSYNNLTNKPSVPSTLLDLNIVDGTATQVLSTDGNGNFSFVDPATFELSVANISELNNDVGYLTIDTLPEGTTGNIYGRDSTLLVDIDNSTINYDVLSGTPQFLSDFIDDLGVNNLQSQVSSLQGQVSSNSQSISSLQGSVSQNTGNISNLQSSVSSLNSTLQTNSGRISTLETQMTQKANQSDISIIGLTGNYVDLATKPGLLDLVGISDGLPGEVLTTDGSGNFLFAPGGVGGGSSYDQTLNTTDDVEFNSVTADSFISSGTGTPSIVSATNIDLEAANRINFIIDTGVVRQTEAYVDSTGFHIGSVVSGTIQGDVKGNIEVPTVIETPLITHNSNISTDISIGDPVATQTIELNAISSINITPTGSLTLKYDPTNSGSWTGNAPSTVGDALDSLISIATTSALPFTKFVFTNSQPGSSTANSAYIGQTLGTWYECTFANAANTFGLSPDSADRDPTLTGITFSGDRFSGFEQGGTYEFHISPELYERTTNAGIRIHSWEVSTGAFSNMSVYSPGTGSFNINGLSCNDHIVVTFEDATPANNWIRYALDSDQSNIYWIGQAILHIKKIG